jgi:hypothetical protein
MGNDVFANGREISCKAADGKAICAFPDVCFTPPQTPATPPGVPIPYPNTGMASETTKGSKNGKISGKEIMLKNKSYFKKSSGDEAGSAPKKGIVTSKIQGKVYFNSWSMDVKFEGENVVRHLDLTTHNHASPPGQTPPWPYVDTMALSTEDDALIDCILELCSSDPEIVQRASSDLTLYSRRPKTIQLQTYDGTDWVTTRTVTSLGTARGSTVWINRGQECSQIKETIYHEVHHTRQPRSMTSREREIDAYTRTEQWMIDRGMPGNSRFRTRAADGGWVPNTAAIEEHVDRAYGYSRTTLRIVAREDGGATVVLEDGTRRQAQRGDTFQHTPPQDLQERRIPPDRLQCP